MTRRVVFDCMVFLQGAASPDGPAAACLRLAEKGHVELCVSSEILSEVRDVLTRPTLLLAQVTTPLSDRLILVTYTRVVK